MANIIILEGLSRTGKSTISKYFSEKYGYRNISFKNKMPDYVENLPDFYHGIHVLFNQIYKEFPNETFILDRSFLSELVYSKFFNRKTYQSGSDVVSNLLLDNNFLLIYLSNNFKSYNERIPKDKIVFTEAEFNRQKDSFSWYFEHFKNNDQSNKWNSRFLRLCTVVHSIDKCIQVIEEKLIEKNIIKKQQIKQK
jgi:thymidylate kinase